MSKALTDKEGQRPLPPGWGPEETPSVLREDEPALARTLGMIGAALVIFGGMALAFNLSGRLVRVGSGWASLALCLGLGGLLFHAAFDRDIQFRRVYMAFAYLCFVAGAFLCFLPYPKIGAQFGPGFLCMGLALPFFLTFHRNETEPGLRNVVELTLGVAGVVMAAVGLFGGSLRAPFLLPVGLLLAFLGLVYLTAFVSARGISDDLGYWGALAVGAAGLLVFVAALVRSFIPSQHYFMPQGALLMGVGALYVLVSVGLWSDWSVVVLTRRELGAFFYSPMAYFVLLGFGLIAWLQLWMFVRLLLPDPMARRPVIEPIVREYVWSLFPILANLALVPVLTMRLLSEERRSGTLEVLLTAPVQESQVVLSKFFAALVMYLVAWLPLGLFLTAIPLGGGLPFDYRPLLSFFVGLVVTGAGFIGMGLFFSSLTRNQIAAAVLTFAGMLGLTAVYLVRGNFVKPESGWDMVLGHMSYLDLWTSTLEGKIIIRDLLFFLSMAIFWPFLTVKVLEARKWM